MKEPGDPQSPAGHTLRPAVFDNVPSPPQMLGLSSLQQTRKLETVTLHVLLFNLFILLTWIPQN